MATGITKATTRASKKGTNVNLHDFKREALTFKARPAQRTVVGLLLCGESAEKASYCNQAALVSVSYTLFFWCKAPLLGESICAH